MKLKNVRSAGLVIAVLLALAVMVGVRPVAASLTGAATLFRPGLALVAGLGGAVALFVDASRIWRRIRRHPNAGHIARFAAISAGAVAAVVILLADLPLGMSAPVA